MLVPGIDRQAKKMREICTTICNICDIQVTSTKVPVLRPVHPDLLRSASSSSLGILPLPALAGWNSTPGDLRSSSHPASSPLRSVASRNMHS